MQSHQQPVYRFSGAPSWDPSALRDALSNARSVRLSRGGYLIYPVDPRADVLDDTTTKYVSVLREVDDPRTPYAKSATTTSSPPKPRHAATDITSPNSSCRRISTDDDPEAEFRVGPDETAAALVGQYLRTCDQARAIVATGDLDDVVTTPWGAEVNLRAILLHIIQETARHNGHADIIRESVDGTTGH